MKATAYLLQAALVCGWWIGLATSPTFFAAFQFAGVPETAFWSLLAPDLFLIAGLSTIRAYRKSSAIEYVVLGAFGYASLYCCNAVLLTRSGFLPTGLMLMGFAYNAILCYNRLLFRTASSTNMVANAAKTLIQIFCIWFLTLVAIPFVILDAFGALALPTREIWLAIGVILFLCFSALGLGSAFFMVRDGGGTPLPLDQTNHLVESGPYSFVRNPMAIAGIGQGVAIATISQSFPILAYSFLGALIWQLVVRPLEERDMAKRFGESYMNYRNRVTCWIPTFRRTAI